jgi:DNA-binding MarR family transcriptional regulator
MASARVTDRDYQRLLGFRTELRRFLHWSEEQAESLGITAAQHQLLLAVRGHDDRRGPTVGDVASSLLLRHHSAVGLVDRAVEDGLVERNRDRSKGVVRVTLTRAGNDRLAALAQTHIEEIAHLAPAMHTLWRALEHADGRAPHPAARPAR